MANYRKIFRHLGYLFVLEGGLDLLGTDSIKKTINSKFDSMTPDLR